MQGNDQPDPGKHRRSRASVRFTCLGRSLRARSARLRPPPVCQARTRETGRRRRRAQGGCTEGAPGPACPPETGRSSSHGHFTHWSPVRQHVEPRPVPRRGRHCPRFSWLLLLPPPSLPPPRPTRCHERERDRERDRALRLEQTELRRPTQWGAGGSWGLPVPLKSTLVLFLRGWNFPATSDSTS